VLADLAPTPDEKRYCLSRALAANPHGSLARRKLQSLGAGSVRSPLEWQDHVRTRRVRTGSALFKAVRDNPVALIVVYLLAVTVTEFLTLIIEPRLGLWGHGALLVWLTIHAALIWGRPFYRLILTLAFAPLIRLVSLSMPLAEFPLIYWYLITSLPLFVSAFLVVHMIGYSRKKIGLTPGNLGIQALVGLSGLVLGYIEYRLLRPPPLFATLAWDQIAIPALILLVSTGFIEELVFRGIMQRAAVECLGDSLGWLYVAAIFAMMHMGHSSWLDILFVFGVSLFFSWVVSRTRSLLGVVLAHGLTNILLFLILPVLDQMSGGSWL
jgi:membrane protease YdiL (CAAX protease family)